MAEEVLLFQVIKEKEYLSCLIFIYPDLNGCPMDSIT